MEIGNKLILYVVPVIQGIVSIARTTMLPGGSRDGSDFLCHAYKRIGPVSMCVVEKFRIRSPRLGSGGHVQFLRQRAHPRRQLPHPCPEPLSIVSEREEIHQEKKSEALGDHCFFCGYWGRYGGYETVQEMP